MASERCATCGAHLPDGARFCVSCGTAVDDGVVVLDLDAPVRASRGDASDGNGGQRSGSAPTVVAIVAIVVLVVITLSVLGGDGEPGPDEPSDDTSSPDTAAPDATSPETTSPPGTTMPVRPEEPAAPSDATGTPLLSPDTQRIPGMALIRIDGPAVTVADLGTGGEVTVPDALPSAVDRIVWTGDRLAAIGGMGGLHIRSPQDQRWERIDLGDYLVSWGYSGGPLIPLTPGLRTEGERLGRVTADGTVDVLDHEVSMWSITGRPLALGDGTFVVSVDGGVYLVGRGLEPERHSFGLALGAEGDRLVRRTCDERLRCELVVDDVATGAVTSLGPVEATSVILSATLAPDGSGAALVHLESGGSVMEVELRNASGAGARHEVGGWMGDTQPFRWSDDGEWLVWANLMGETVEAARWSDPSATPVAASIHGDNARFGLDPNRYVVLPLSALPDSWRPGGD